MASIEIFDENTINVSMGEENIIRTGVSSPDNVTVNSTDGWYERAYEEKDPLFTQSVASEITSTDINNWNNKQPSGDYANERITNLEIDTLFN